MIQGGAQQLPQAPANMGPVSMQQSNQGNMAAALSDLKAIVTMMEKILPLVPMGTKLHTKVLGAIKDFSAELSQGDENQGQTLQSLLQMIKGMQSNGQMQALMRMNPTQAPGSPPAMPAGGGGEGPTAQ